MYNISIYIYGLNHIKIEIWTYHKRQQISPTLQHTMGERVYAFFCKEKNWEVFTRQESTDANNMLTRCLNAIRRIKLMQREAHDLRSIVVIFDEGMV